MHIQMYMTKHFNFKSMMKRSFTQIIVLESLVVSLKKFKSGLHCIFSTKINSIKTPNFNVKNEEIKVLGGKNENFFQFWRGEGLYSMSQDLKAITIKE